MYARTASRARALHEVARVVELDVERHGATVHVTIDGLPAETVGAVVGSLLGPPYRGPVDTASVSAGPGVTVTLHSTVRAAA